MNTKSAQMRTKSVQHGSDTILIPELEEAIEQGKTGKFGRGWSDKEIAILQKYYGRVDTALILPYLPGRTVSQIQNKAGRLGISGRKP